MNPKSRLSLFRAIKELRKLLVEHDVSAKRFVGTVLTSWCRQAYKAIGPHGLPVSKALRREPQLVAFVDFLCTADFLESTYWLSSAYAMLADDAHRKKLALFFTPPSLVRGLLDDLGSQGAKFEEHTFYDPACGGAAFLAPIALRMRDRLREKGKTSLQILRHIEEHLRGTDVEPTLCALSRHFLRMALHAEIQQTGVNPCFKVGIGDSLRSSKGVPKARRVVVCNPPYRKMTAEEVAPLRKSFKHIIEAQPNIYALFIARCVELAGNSGLVGLVTPTSFLSGRYFHKLRSYLMANTDLVHIGMVSSRLGVFIDVEQETALCILRKWPVHQSHASNVKVSVVSGNGVYTHVGECALPNSGAAWPIPRTPEDVKLLAVASRIKFRLVDYGYRVRIGLFVWNRDVRPCFASRKLARRGKARHALPLVWSKDIVVTGDEAKLVFEPDSRGDDKDAFVDLGGLNLRGVIRRPSVVLQRVTSNDQPLRLVAAAVPEKFRAKYKGFVGENHIVVLEQFRDDPAIAPQHLAALLRSKPIDRYFRCISGATNVSAFELNQLVLPDPARLQAALAKSESMDLAVLRAFGVEAI
ncbi:MAG: N-6 DNA methylase [Rhodocyclaceae bacterium]|nr:N-6 DNA methylase [Rhodocyclaceae bacterium]MCA3109826.1 N-6 DNA methylase [Rhodocyclaceae bacterium]MCA3113802.1 N-6 DNA methylase [Rhodocyclaceae bacterium]MCA3118349.1 N-6 DNA methylase [Rhodocyclaceae bacterium]MCA3124080.1 N-6 DNA methylase [Rhodocyclaceae bacterium]